MEKNTLFQNLIFNKIVNANFMFNKLIYFFCYINEKNK